MTFVKELQVEMFNRPFVCAFAISLLSLILVVN